MFPLYISLGICRLSVKLHLKTPAIALQARANTGSLLGPLLPEKRTIRGLMWCSGQGFEPKQLELHQALQPTGSMNWGKLLTFLVFQILSEL